MTKWGIIIIMVLFSSIIKAQRPEGYDDKLKSMYNNSVPFITVFELIGEKNRDPKLVVLDAREKAEYNVSHIEGAIYLGFNNFELSDIDFLPRNTKIVIYCTLGVRSEIIGEKLKIAGFNNVRNLYGGLFEWVFQDQPIVNKKGKITTEVHISNPEWGKLLLKGDKVSE